MRSLRAASTPELDRGERPDRARGADERRRVPAIAGICAADVGELVAHDRHRLTQLLRGRRIGVQELLGEPHAPDVDRAQAFGLVGADDELGRTAADVDDEIRARVRSGSRSRRGTRAAPRPRPRAARAARRARCSTGSKRSSRLLASRAALVAVARTRSTPSSSMTPRYSRSTASVRSIASGCSVRSRSTPWPRRVICVRRSTVTSLASRPRPSTSATSRRVELVPMSIAATRVIAGAPRPNGPPDRRRPRGGTRGARAGTSRRGRCRRRPRSAAGRRDRARARRRVRGRSARAPRRASSGVDRGFRGAHAAGRLEPRDPQRQVGVDEPVARRHRRAVVEQRRVADHDRVARPRCARRPRTRRAARRPSSRVSTSTSSRRRDRVGRRVGRRHDRSLRNAGQGTVVVLVPDGVASPGTTSYTCSPG